MSGVFGSSLFNCSLLVANKSETEGLWGGRAHLLLNPGRAQSGRARQARLSKWIDWWFCRDLQILVKSQKNFSSGSEGAKTTFGCAKQGPPRSRYLLCFTMVWWFLQLFWCSEKKKIMEEIQTENTLTWLRIGKHVLFWEIQELNLCDTSKGRLRDDMMLMSYGCRQQNLPKDRVLHFLDKGLTNLMVLWWID